MKNTFKFAAIAAILVAIVCVLTPSAEVSAKKKEKMPKNNQKFYSETFEERVPESDGNGYWIVKKDKDGDKTYMPVVKVRRNSKTTIIHAEEMYVIIDGKTYYVDEDGVVVWSNPDGFEVSKYGYIIQPGKWKAGTLPKNNQTFKNSSFVDLVETDGAGYWEVKEVGEKKMYRPICIKKNGNHCVACDMYVTIEGYQYYLDGDGYVTKKNPDNYEVSKNLYVIIPEKDNKDSGKSDNGKAENGKTDNGKTSSGSKTGDSKGKYTIKKQSDKYVCFDEKGNSVYGWVDDYYFSTWSGMSIGLCYIDGEYYYFSEDLTSLGKVKRSFWNGSMFFGNDGKAVRGQQIKIGENYYRFNDYGYMITGWYGNDEYYSSDPDRYGQLVPGVKR